jgi:hypothetical protein
MVVLLSGRCVCGLLKFGGLIARSHMNELDKSIQKLFELRSYADIRAMKKRKTSLGRCAHHRKRIQGWFLRASLRAHRTIQSSTIREVTPKVIHQRNTSPTLHPAQKI